MSKKSVGERRRDGNTRIRELEAEVRRYRAEAANHKLAADGLAALGRNLERQLRDMTVRQQQVFQALSEAGLIDIAGEVIVAALSGRGPGL